MIDRPKATLEHPDPHGEDSRTPVPRGRQTMPAGKVLVVLLVALLVWGALSAPSLKRASEAQPLGTRRTVSLWVLRPVAAISDFVHALLGDRRRDAPARARPRRGAGRLDRRAGPRRVPHARAGRHGLAEARRAGGRGLEDPPAHPARTSCGSWSSATRSPPASASTSSASSGRPSCTSRARAASRPGSRGWTTSTGSARCRRSRTASRPDVVVVMIGDNDNQSLQSPGGQTVAEIGSLRVAAGLRGPGRGVHAHRGRRRRPRGVGGPADRAAQGALGRDAAPERHLRARRRRHPQRASSSTCGTGSPTATASTRPSYWEGGRAELIRASDGLHFTPLGYELMAEAVIESMTDAFRLSPATLDD